MRWIVAAFAAVLVVVTAASPAVAGEVWSAPVDAWWLALPFGAEYAGKVHRGVDLAADAGASVQSPADGLVTFAGNVPADGGGTCGAVTVELEDGLKVSLLPLAEVFVSAGDSVSAAEAVGTLAAAGDDSSGAAHLHLGARRGSAYVDPTGFLPVAHAETAEPTAEAVTEVPEPAQAAAPPDAVGSVARGGASAPNASPEQGATTTEASAADPAAEVAAPAVAEDRSAVHAGATRARDVHAVPEDAGVPSPSALAGPATDAAWAWSIPTVATAGAALPAVAAAVTALAALAAPRLRAARVRA